MLTLLSVLVAALLAFNPQLVSGLGCDCTGPLGDGTAAPTDPYWMETIPHQGISAFNPDNETYPVYRNVKDFGAAGDGVCDDTAAINAAISEGNRCGIGCLGGSSSVSPAVVYFPAGTYLVSEPIIALYYTQLIGDAKNPPTLRATSDFNGSAVIDADPFIPGGNGTQYYINQNNFYRSVRNFVIDLTCMNATSTGTGIHWQVSQATSLANIVFRMSKAEDTAHQGIFMENGSGGYMGDLIFHGGKYGMNVGNQQFTVRNVTFNYVKTAVFNFWNWGWTFQHVVINDCQVGFDLITPGVGAIAVIDAIVTNTPIFIRNSSPSPGKLAGSLVLNNVELSNVLVAVADVVLAGTTESQKIDSWGRGNVYNATSPDPTFTQGNITSVSKSASLLDRSGNIFGKTQPQYADYSPDQFVSVKSHGAKGDGITDDTEALQAVFDKYSGCKIVFFDAGTYVVTSTLAIPAGTRMVGEAWSVIAGSGEVFQDIGNPQVVVQVGEPGSQGVTEISDIVFTTMGPASGAIVVQWNVRQPHGHSGAAGMWDTHIRLGGTAGTDVSASQCREIGGTLSEYCSAAFLGLYLAPHSTAYLQGTWVWAADHNLDPPAPGDIILPSARGILSQTAGPVWLIGTASEHHTIYQYNLVHARNHYMGFIQTETPYGQPVPPVPRPFTIDPAYHDPLYPANLTSSWAVSVQNSSNITIFGAGLYSFFQNFSSVCSHSISCQSQILDVDSHSSVAIYSLSTVGATFQVSLDGHGVVNQSLNANGFAQTVTFWNKE